MADSDLPIFDVTGVYFQNGVSNFTPANVYDALRSVGITNRLDLRIILDVAVYDALDSNDRLDHHTDGKITYKKFTVEINPNSDCSSRVQRSTIISPCGKSVVLITREF